MLIKHADGFTEAERPASVPKDAMLEADLELVSWRSVEDVTPDGGVVKKVRSSSVRLQASSSCGRSCSTLGSRYRFRICWDLPRDTVDLHVFCHARGLRAPSCTLQTLTEGSEWKKPNQGASVKAHAVGRLQDGTVFEDADLDFVTDEGEGRGDCTPGAADAAQDAGSHLLWCGLVGHLSNGDCCPRQSCWRPALRLHLGRLTQGGASWLQRKCRRGWTWRCRR